HGEQEKVHESLLRLLTTVTWIGMTQNILVSRAPCGPARYNPIMLRMLVITAHPDDEAGNFGGSLCLYHDRGVETCVLCLTPGQAATHRGGARSDQELALIRRQEFAASC